MPIDPSLITDTLARWQSPQFTMPDPLAQYAKIQALKNGIMQQQSDALDLQQKQQQIAGQKALDDAMTNAYTRNPDGSLELNADAVTNGLTQKGFGHLVPGLLKNFTDMKKSAADAQTAQVASKNATNDYIASALGTVYDSGFDPHVAIGALAHAVDTGIVPAQQAAALTAQIQQNPTTDGVKQAFAPLFAASPGFQERIQKAQTAQAATTRAEAAKTEAGVAQTKEAVDTIQRAKEAVAGATDQPTLNAARAALIAAKASPADVAAIPMTFDRATIAAYNRAILKPEQRTQADQASAAADETKKRDAATEAYQSGELRNSTARTALAQQTFNVTQENAKNLGLQGVPPHLAGAAAADYAKAGNEFATASGAADTMQLVLDLAAKGNKAAGSNLPLVGVETLNAINGIKRINSAEIAQYGTAGSLLDQIKGKIGKLAVGAPIPADVLNDIRELHTQIAQQAATTYARKVQIANQTYGSKFQPVQFAAPGAAGATYANTATGANGHKIGTNDGGKTWFDVQSGAKVQ